MLLKDVLATGLLPAELNGPVTAPSARVRVLHYGPCTGTSLPLEGKFHLTGCISCANTRLAQRLDQLLKSTESQLATLRREVAEALVMEEEGPWGRTQHLASHRIHSDLDWTRYDDEDGEDDDTVVSIISAVRAAVAGPTAEIFATEPYRRDLPIEDLAFVSPQYLLELAPELIVNQIPLKLDVVAGDIRVLISLPRETETPTRRIYYNRPGPKVLRTKRSREELTAPKYADAWKLGMEILSNQIEQLEAELRNLPGYRHSRESVLEQHAERINLDEILTAAEAAVR